MKRFLQGSCCCMQIPITLALPWWSCGWKSILSLLLGVQSLLKEQRPHLPCSEAKKQKNKKQKTPYHTLLGHRLTQSPERKKTS